MKPEDQILVHHERGETPALVLSKRGAPSSTPLDYSRKPDPFRAAVEATLAPAPPKTRRVYRGGGL